MNGFRMEISCLVDDLATSWNLTEEQQQSVKHLYDICDTILDRLEISEIAAPVVSDYVLLERENDRLATACEEAGNQLVRALERAEAAEARVEFLRNHLAKVLKEHEAERLARHA